MLQRQLQSCPCLSTRKRDLDEHPPFPTSRRVDAAVRQTWIAAWPDATGTGPDRKAASRRRLMEMQASRRRGSSAPMPGTGSVVRQAHPGFADSRRRHDFLCPAGAKVRGARVGTEGSLHAPESPRTMRPDCQERQARPSSFPTRRSTEQENNGRSITHLPNPVRCRRRSGCTVNPARRVIWRSPDRPRFCGTIIQICIQFRP